MKSYRFKIQVGNEHTYCVSTFALNDIIEGLVNEISIDELRARAQGEKPPPVKHARLEEILITVEEYTPPSTQVTWEKKTP